MSTDVSLHNEAEILAAIKSVRDDKQAIDWVVVGHKDGNPNVLDLQATGTDGFVGLKAKLDSTKVQYALLRVTAKVDMSVTVKFVYIYNLGEKGTNT